MTSRWNSAYWIASNGKICSIEMFFFFLFIIIKKCPLFSCSNWIRGFLVFSFDMWNYESDTIIKPTNNDGYNLRKLGFCEWYLWETWWSLLGRDDERLWDASSSQYDDTYRRLKDINLSQSFGMIIGGGGGDEGNSTIVVCSSSWCALATSYSLNVHIYSRLFVKFAVQINFCHNSIKCVCVRAL